MRRQRNGSQTGPSGRIEHKQAFTDRLYEIQWVDFAHGRLLRTL
jgi:hypothetical protein